MIKKAIYFLDINKSKYSEIDESVYYYPSEYEQEKYGVKTISRPIGDPREGEIQVEAIVGGICTHEVSIFNGELPVPKFPLIPGHEAVHRVVKPGKGVTGFKEGDLVSCCWYIGQWSRVVNGPVSGVFHLPSDMMDPFAWIIEPAASIVNAASYFDIQPGNRVLMIGAGFMGLMMVQLLSHYPLTELVVSETRNFNREFAAGYGATEILNPLSSSGIGRIEEFIAKPFDLVVECSGTQPGLDTAIRLCKAGGTIALFGWHRKPRTVDLCTGHLRGHRLLNTSPGIDTGKEYQRHWQTTIQLIQKGVFNLSPLITHIYNAEDIQRAMEDSMVRAEGFIKSAVRFE